MKTKEELLALKSEVEEMNRKLAELNEEELKLVTGGAPDSRDKMIIENQIRSMIMNRLGVRNVERESRIIDDLGADSLDVVDIVTMVENMFDVQIPESEFEELHTVGDIVNAVKKR